MPPRFNVEKTICEFMESVDLLAEDEKLASLEGTLASINEEIELTRSEREAAKEAKKATKALTKKIEGLNRKLRCCNIALSRIRGMVIGSPLTPAPDDLPEVPHGTPPAQEEPPTVTPAPDDLPEVPHGTPPTQEEPPTVTPAPDDLPEVPHVVLPEVPHGTPPAQEDPPHVVHPHDALPEVPVGTPPAITPMGTPPADDVKPGKRRGPEPPIGRRVRSRIDSDSESESEPSGSKRGKKFVDDDGWEDGMSLLEKEEEKALKAAAEAMEGKGKGIEGVAGGVVYEDDDDVPVVLTGEALAKEEAEFEAAADIALHNFITHNVLFPPRIRTRARREQSYLREAGTTSRVLAMSVFLIGNQKGHTKCAYHSHCDTRSTLNDMVTKKRTGVVRKKPVPKVTGVPLAGTKDVIATPEAIAKVAGASRSLKLTRLHTHNPDPSVMLPVVNGMRERELLTYFRFVGDEYFLHCGCELEDCLTDLFVWKSLPMLTSISTGAQEWLGIPPNPQYRLAFNVFLRSLGFKVDDFYTYDRSGVKKNTETASSMLRTFMRFHGRTLPTPDVPRAPRAPIPYVEIDSDTEFGLRQLNEDSDSE
ncbi:hypothetical protein DFP72DRAFT_1081631 [Ephemerocybe angulata]|uniref:Uncharacterized protein n=1 Tax=Ephemerocybe angulata TaxID=980116 RepID=A0A8H6HA20_9AGAR|nr:hypothetical protein DFP72DRAFT_1081631 [Tulosesus angulatus]